MSSRSRRAGSRDLMRKYVWEGLTSGPVVKSDQDPPVPKGNNPFYQWDAEQQKFVPIPGSPADK